MRQHYFAELARLQTETQTLGHLVAGAVVEAVRVLARMDQPAAERLIAWDHGVDERRYQIEHDALALIATQAPVAGDIRLLAAIIDIADELERIGDYAKGIGKIVRQSRGDPYPAEIIQILQQMAESSRDMLLGALDAFRTGDEDAATDIFARDDAVDALFKQVFAHVISKGHPEPSDVERANYLLWIAHNLERTADRATNIAERVIFTVSGRIVAA